MFEITKSTVLWSSKKQPTIATLSVEAEYMVSLNATKKAIWLRTLLGELNFLQVSTTIIHTNNQSYIALAYNPVNYSHAKHINIKHHFIHEYIKQDKVKLKYISIKNILANIFIKQVPRESFVRFRERCWALFQYLTEWKYQK